MAEAYNALTKLFPFRNHPFKVLDDEAMLMMVDSNLQREHMLPSEKAWAYKMKLVAIKRKAGRPAEMALIETKMNRYGFWVRFPAMSIRSPNGATTRGISTGGNVENLKKGYVKVQRDLLGLVRKFAKL